MGRYMNRGHRGDGLRFANGRERWGVVGNGAVATPTDSIACHGANEATRVRRCEGRDSGLRVWFWVMVNARSAQRDLLLSSVTHTHIMDVLEPRN